MVINMMIQFMNGWKKAVI